VTTVDFFGQSIKIKKRYKIEKTALSKNKIGKLNKGKKRAIFSKKYCGSGSFFCPFSNEDIKGSPREITYSIFSRSLWIKCIV
jgi:hypothetical protein